MTGAQTLQDVLLGYPLDDLARRRGAGGENSVARRSFRSTRAFSGNARRLPQSVVKRIKAGGTHSSKELTRQMEYISREDAAHATWTNFNGFDRDWNEKTIERTVNAWSSSWRGAPKRGHTDHIILSFPKGVDAGTAEDISRAWGQAMFASGDYGDQWRYVAAVHEDPDHVHAHFIVDKVGCEFGNFLSISMKSDLNYDVMRERHAEISTAHGVEMVASNRLSRGIIEYPPRETDYRAAHAMTGSGAGVAPEPMCGEERARREEVVADFARQYFGLGQLAALTSHGQDFMAKLSQHFFDASTRLSKGEELMTNAEILTAPEGSDPIVQMEESKQNLVEQAQSAWDAIQDLEPSAERAQLEAEFSRTSSDVVEALQNEPVFQEHTMIADASEDMFGNLSTSSAQHVRNELAQGDPGIEAADTYLSDARDALIAEFDQSREVLERLGTTAEELAEYVIQGEHSVAQVDAFNERFDIEAGDLRLQDRVEEIEGDSSSTSLNHFLTGVEDPEGQAASLTSAEFTTMVNDGHRLVTELEVPREIEEAVALVQIQSVDPGTRLSDLPAVEQIAIRMESELSDGALEAIRVGDVSVLEAGISDPVVREAVASEIQSDDAAPFETVERFQDMASERQTEASVQSGIELDDGHDL